MALVSEENFVRLKVVLYALLFFFFFFATIAVPITTDKLGGCFLYADRTSSGAASTCNYVIAMPIMFQLVYGLLRLVTLVLLMIGKLKADVFLFSEVFQLVYLIIDVIACFLVFVSACILSAGISSTCDEYVVAGIDCDNVIFLHDSSALSRMHTAEAGAWISFVLWLLLVLASVFWLFRQGKLPCLARRPDPPAAEPTAPEAS